MWVGRYRGVGARALPYRFGFLKQIYGVQQRADSEDVLRRSLLWEGHRLGTGCDLAVRPAKANNFRRPMP